MLTSKQVRKISERKRKSPLYHVLLKPKNDTALEDDKSSGIKEVLSKYEDVFPENVTSGITSRKKC